MMVSCHRAINTCLVWRVQDGIERREICALAEVRLSLISKGIREPKAWIKISHETAEKHNRGIAILGAAAAA